MSAGGLMQLVAYGSYNPYVFRRNAREHAYGGFIYSPHEKKQPKAKKQRIRCFKKFKNFRKKDKYDQHTCCICLERHKAEEFVAVRMCGHAYHQECNSECLIACPVCRRE